MTQEAYCTCASRSAALRPGTCRNGTARKRACSWRALRAWSAGWCCGMPTRCRGCTRPPWPWAWAWDSTTAQCTRTSAKSASPGSGVPCRASLTRPAWWASCPATGWASSFTGAPWPLSACSARSCACCCQRSWVETGAMTGSTSRVLRTTRTRSVRLGYRRSTSLYALKRIKTCGTYIICKIFKRTIFN